ncbi:MAG: hypothetical protein PHI85_03710 [Victivallaceae bacterium]|nr:hypothetical protein [Victivallaceae bacterium]
MPEEKEKKEIDEQKLLELLDSFEREQRASAGYPRWKAGILWGAAAWMFAALLLFILYLPGIKQTTMTWPLLCLGASGLAAAVWTVVTFRPDCR